MHPGAVAGLEAWTVTCFTQSQKESEMLVTGHSWKEMGLVKKAFKNGDLNCHLQEFKGAKGPVKGLERLAVR